MLEGFLNNFFINTYTSSKVGLKSVRGSFRQHVWSIFGRAIEYLDLPFPEELISAQI